MCKRNRWWRSANSISDEISSGWLCIKPSMLAPKMLLWTKQPSYCAQTLRCVAKGLVKSLAVRPGHQPLDMAPEDRGI